MDIIDHIDKIFRGIIYVEQHDTVLCESTTGFAIFANRIPNTIDTRFESASAGKVFVAVAVMQLIEQGALYPVGAG